MDRLPPIPATAPISRRTQEFRATNLRLQKLIDTNKASELLDLNQSYISNAHAVQKDQELLDLSSQLRALRKDFDKNRASSVRNEKTLIALSTEKRQIEQMITADRYRSSRLQDLEKQVQETKKSQTDQENNKEIYLNMLDRMRTTRTYLIQRANEFREELRHKDIVLEDAKRKAEKAKVFWDKSRFAYKQLRDNAKMQVSICKNDVNRINSDIQNVERAKLRKEELRRIQQEKIEQDVINTNSQKAESLRERLMLNRFWHSLIIARFERESQKWQKIESAFQTIKVRTGISDTMQVVERFLTKEQTLDDLMVTVRKRELDLEKFKERIEHLQNHVNELSSLTNKKEEFYNEKEQIKNELRALRDVMTKKNTIRNSYLKVRSWLQKINQRIRKNLSLEDDVQHDTVISVLNSIKATISQTMTQLQEQKENVTFNIDQIKSQPIAELIDIIPSNLRIGVKQH